MGNTIVPHFHNDLGVSVIEIGAKEFMCVGATPPFDHPHVYCDMGDDTEHVCPYCSTLYRRNPALEPGAARPQNAPCTTSPSEPLGGGRVLTSPRTGSSPVPASAG